MKMEVILDKEDLEEESSSSAPRPSVWQAAAKSPPMDLLEAMDPKTVEAPDVEWQEEEEEQEEEFDWSPLRFLEEGQ
jgi:hypothetical protein